jgi:putative transposase
MSDGEAALRRQAVRRRLAGESPEAIASDLGRSRQWVAKWAGRYDPEDPGWAAGRSRAPKHVANRTPADVTERVLAVRGRLAENPWAQVGAGAIAWELSKLDGPAVPPTRTIEESKGLPYPAPAVQRLGDVVQVDLVGPRHLDGGVRFHALNRSIWPSLCGLVL